MPSSAAFGLVVGPVVGGLLGEVGFLRLTPWTCFFMCMASFAVLYSSVDSSSLGKAYADPSDAPFVGNVRAGVAVVFETPALLSAFVCKALFMFTESLLLAVLPMGLVYTAGASMLTVGVVLSTVAATLAFTNAFVLPTLLSRFTDAALATGGCAVLATSAALLSFVATAPNPSMFWTSALAALWASATPVLSSVYSGQMSELPALDDADAVAALDTVCFCVPVLKLLTASLCRLLVGVCGAPRNGVLFPRPGHVKRAAHLCPPAVRQLADVVCAVTVRRMRLPQRRAVGHVATAAGTSCCRSAVVHVPVGCDLCIWWCVVLGDRSQAASRRINRKFSLLHCHASQITWRGDPK